MKNANHYSNIAFAAILSLTSVWSTADKEFGITGIIIVLTGWAYARILRDAISSAIYLIKPDTDK